MNLILAKAIQKSYDSAIEYLECLGKLSALNRSNKPIQKQDMEALLIAYSNMKSAQWEIDKTVDGGMTDSKN